jgi:tetratricopeptide (TPR) repeat protein
LGKYEDAAKYYDRAIEINPKDPSFFNNKGK